MGRTLLEFFHQDLEILIYFHCSDLLLFTEGMEKGRIEEELELSRLIAENVWKLEKELEPCL